jgi:hypothetical protein
MARASERLDAGDGQQTQETMPESVNADVPKLRKDADGTVRVSPMTGEEKIAFVQRQFDQIWTEGVERTIECPYCLRHVQPGALVCCPLMAAVAAALIERAQIVEQGMKSFESRMFRRSLMN